jgi:ABC-type multidrug transport system fused ATPase/permease subunit
MSMGQRQRLRIAMTFLPRPEVVHLDEPLTSLDEEGTALLQAAVEEVLAAKEPFCGAHPAAST